MPTSLQSFPIVNLICAFTTFSTVPVFLLTEVLSDAPDTLPSMKVKDPGIES